MAIMRGMPPHGFAGHAQQTAATHVTHARMVHAAGGRRFAGRSRRKRAYLPKAPSSFKRRKAASTSSRVRTSGRMRKGSAAAKAWGRKMKRMRGRR
jgi:hypothetical protein